jgi:molybdate transport system ATP-binding protein
MFEAHIVKRRRDFTVDVPLQIQSRGCLALFGRSGSGKSTVLSCIAGIEPPDAGFVRLDGRQFFPPHLPLRERPVGYLTQEPHLFPHLSVGGNVSFGLGSRPAREESAWLDHLRDSLGLAEVWSAPAGRISGGQARRVALARMLARRPPLVLLDEPFTGLDRQLVRELIETLLAWKQEIGFSMIVVDHQAEILQRLCSCVVVLDRGSVLQQGSWDAIRAAPADPALAQLLNPL